ncbi:MAG: ATP-dependent DNA helicase [Rhodospirillales bacterium]|nr:ATP-dependent DNA helicase [Rhodospirillales bacterium]
MALPPTVVRARRPDAPALVAGVGQAVWISAAGEIETLSLADAAARLERGVVPFVCHARSLCRRLDLPRVPTLDLLELFAFVRPAKFCLPTPLGLAQALGLPVPGDRDESAMLLFQAASQLLDELAATPDDHARAIAVAMAQGGWIWGGAVVAALGGKGNDAAQPIEAFKVWKSLPAWEERGPEPAPGTLPIAPEESRSRLADLLGTDAESRPGQSDYAAEVAAAFEPRQTFGEPHFVVAEAGTGVGKTLGYLAPASLWAERNKGAVWVSTYTRNLQRQLDQELDRVFPNADDKRSKVVVRKGRENYFCLLNFDDALAQLSRPGATAAVGLGLMARWARASRDGDMVGGDFPAWLVDLVGRGATLELTDTRGECVYSACPHYDKCFIERNVRKARRAQIVVGNHALAMVQAALGGGDESAGTFLPTRYVFDEGHHVFDAADAAFAATLSGIESEDLRRWLIGAEGRRSRARGLASRLSDLVRDRPLPAASLEEVLMAARALPGRGWHQRLAGEAPLGPTEAFLAQVSRQVYARAVGAEAGYGLETDVRPPLDGLLDAAAQLEVALQRLIGPARDLVRHLRTILVNDAAQLDTAARLRLDAVARGLERRAQGRLEAWIAMLGSLRHETPPEFVDWFAVERIDGRDTDVAFHRRWLDPTQPFVEVVAKPAHGVLVTSATLRDSTGEPETDWTVAEARTGGPHLPLPPVRVAVASPFDYVARTRVLVVTDVVRTDVDQIASAYRELFLAAGGGGLGLFTAITRLRAVHARIAGPLEKAGIALHAQHVDALDAGTLIDIFRAEENSCLLGTDAVRDGVDVPGRSLRLIVFDRVPWPRPDILHKARRAAFGGRAYEERLVRLKLKQAYGRLIRRADDAGVFVMLDRQLPSRLFSAFPDGVTVQRLGLKDALAATLEFLGHRTPRLAAPATVD